MVHFPVSDPAACPGSSPCAPQPSRNGAAWSRALQTASPPASCPPPATGLGDRALQALQNGGSVKFVMTANLDSKSYTGDANGAGDVAGTIDVERGAEYTVSRNAATGAWTTAGYNEGDGKYVSGEQYPYFENMLGSGMMNVWGRGLRIDHDGSVIDPEYGKIGRVVSVGS